MSAVIVNLENFPFLNIGTPNDITGRKKIVLNQLSHKQSLLSGQVKKNAKFPQTACHVEAFEKKNLKIAIN